MSAEIPRAKSIIHLPTPREGILKQRGEIGSHFELPQGKVSIDRLPEGGGLDTIAVRVEPQIEEGTLKLLNSRINNPEVSIESVEAFARRVAINLPTVLMEPDSGVAFFYNQEKIGGIHKEGGFFIDKAVILDDEEIIGYNLSETGEEKDLQPGHDPFTFSLYQRMQSYVPGKDGLASKLLVIPEFSFISPRFEVINDEIWRVLTSSKDPEEDVRRVLNATFRIEIKNSWGNDGGWDHKENAPLTDGGGKLSP